MQEQASKKLWNTQNLTEKTPEQPDLNSPCFEQGMGLDGIQRSLPISIILWFYESNTGRYKNKGKENKKTK